MLNAEISIVIHHARLRRIASIEERRARRIAERILCIGPVEARAARGEPVDVRRPDDGVAVAAQLRAQVVGDDEEHVVARLLIGREKRGVFGAAVLNGKSAGEKPGEKKSGQTSREPAEKPLKIVSRGKAS